MPAQKNYNGLSCLFNSPCSSAIKKGHLVPDEMWSGSNGSHLENVFGGGVEIHYNNKKSMGDNKAFAIALQSLPEEACMALATYDWGSDSSSGLIAVAVNDTTPSGMAYYTSSLSSYASDCTGKSNNNIAIACPRGSTVSIPMPVNIAATACKEGENNMVSVKFY